MIPVFNTFNYNAYIFEIFAIKIFSDDKIIDDKNKMEHSIAGWIGGV